MKRPVYSKRFLITAAMVVLFVGAGPHQPDETERVQRAELESLEIEYEALEQRLVLLKGQYTGLISTLSENEGRYFDTANISEGRLSLESGVPISTTDQIDATQIYFTPYHGSLVSLYTGSAWRLYQFTELSLNLSGLTANKNYDVFLAQAAGVLQLELSSAWTSDTARTDALALQDGVYTLAADPTRRYLGTFRATDTDKTQDRETQRFLWNYQNQTMRILRKADDSGADTWTYASASWRAARNDANNRVEFVDGLGTTLVHLYALAVITNSTGTLAYYAPGIGVDSTSTNSALIFGAGSSDSVVNQSQAEYLGYPGLGSHSLYWLEISNTSGITVRGDNGDSSLTQSGIQGYLRG